jgi:hypothetical protein
MQPLIGKALLPGFGGSFTVWAIVLTFFQGTLFLGYLLTHLLFSRALTRPRLLLFGGALLATTCFFPFPRPESWETVSRHGLVIPVLLLLIRHAFVPALLLATCSVSLQRFWGMRSSPFHLFAFSNAGSLLGILALPLVFEVWFPLSRNFAFFAAGFRIWAGLMLLSLPWQRSLGSEHPEELLPEALPAISAWLLPAAAGSAMLVATTNVLTLDVAGVPLLWMLPLLAYILTFILAFRETVSHKAPETVFHLDTSLLSCPEPEEPPFALRFFWLILASAFAMSFLQTLGFAVPMAVKLLFHLLLLFFLCLACHQVLFSRRPHQSPHLTRFYLAVSLGGWLGGAVVTFFAPIFFRGLSEFPLSLFFAAWAVWSEPFWKLEKPDPFFLVRALGLILLLFILPALVNRGMPETGPFMVTAGAGALFYVFHALREANTRGINRTLAAAVAALSLFCLEQFGAASGHLQFATRTPYGVYRVLDQGGIRHLQMGSTFHGHEALTGPQQGRPIMYYHPKTPIGEFLSHPATKWNRAAVVGLGAGIMATFARPDQWLDFFEIDPECEPIARRWFSFLRNFRGRLSIITGDGRLELRRVPPFSYDLIILDAFSSDAIPTHLLTLEAIREYRTRLVPDGLLLFHISNRHLLLGPVLKAAADALQLDIRIAENPEPEDPMALPTRWAALGSPEVLNRHLAGFPVWKTPLASRVSVHPWTDQHINILEAFAFQELTH